MKIVYLILCILFQFQYAQASVFHCVNLFSQSENLVLAGSIDKTFPVAFGRLFDKGFYWKRTFSDSEAAARDKRLAVKFEIVNLDNLYESYFEIYQSEVNKRSNISLANDVTKDEALAIHLYMQSWYGYINRSLLTGSSEMPELGPIIQVLNSGLKKLDPHVGLVTRYLKINNIAEYLNQHKVGEIVEYKSFTSASKKPGWVWPGNVKLQIFSQTGRDLQSNEHEILFLPNTRFEVMEVKVVNFSDYYIILKEVH